MLTRRAVEKMRTDGCADIWQLLDTLEAAVAAARHFESCDMAIMRHRQDLCSECVKHRELLRQFDGNN
jgi:hypothetical protein